MTQQIVTLDSQILNLTSLCKRKTKYTIIDSIAPAEKAEALERGDLMHKMLEVYEGLRCNIARLRSDTWRDLAEAGLVVFDEETGALVRNEDNKDPFNFAIRAGRFFATKMDLGADEIEEVIYQFTEYIEYYRDDPWETLDLESVGTKLLYEDEDLKLLYTFKIDRLAKRERIIAPWDYKTSKKRSETSSLSNQFIGYAWATGSYYVIVDKIGFQKTLSRSERFQRIILSYDQERIDEWVSDSIYWAREYAALLRNPENAPRNLTSCDKYSGCIFKTICEHSPSSRDWIIERDYRVVETWDPSKVLETKA